MIRLSYRPKNTHIKLRDHHPKKFDLLFHTQGTIVKSDQIKYQSLDQDPVPDQPAESPATQTAKNEQK